MRAIIFGFRSWRDGGNSVLRPPSTGGVMELFDSAVAEAVAAALEGLTEGG